MTNNDQYFLAGGGQMGELIRSKDWSKTSLGNPDTWPQSLRTMVAVMLDNPFAMYIAWGNDYTQIYNDAYRPILGSTKHPDALGISTRDTFSEIWHIIGDMFDNVMQGRAVGFPDFMLPLNRNGFVEECYFDFSYSPIRKKNGEVGGVLVTVIEVTEKVEARKITEQNEERLSIIVEASELGTWELNVKTKDLHYSKRYLEIITGSEEYDNISHEELLKYVHPEDLHIRKKALKDAIISGHLYYEARLIWNDRSIHWVEAKGKVFYDSDNNPEKLIGTARDITAVKNHQHELEKSEKRFRLLAGSMPQFIWTSDTEGNLNYFNESVYEYSGFTLEQINESGWIQIVHPDDRKENIKLWLNAITTGKDFLCEHRFKRYDGEYRWQLSRAVPQIDENGKIQMWVGTSTDIQEQKTFTNELEKQVKERTKELCLINETLKKSEERYHLMVEEVQDYAILYLNNLGIVENWNIGAEKIKGYKSEEIVGKNFSNFYTEADQKSDLPQKLLSIAKEKGKAVQEGWRVRKNGSLFWANVVITAVHNKKNEIIGFSKVTHDLTEKKRADDKLKLNALELEQKNVELENMNKELQSFTYISSHDLQEPLRKIQTFASQIIERESQNLSDIGKDKFQRIQNAAQRMQALINDLLTYSRTNVQERFFEKMDLANIINLVKEDLKEELLQKHATVECNKTLEINIIPFQFRQLLYNLFSNSLKFSIPDVPVHIKIQSEIAKGKTINNTKLSKEKNYCHIQISDNGIGFDPEYNSKIFEVFQRLHGKNEYQGTGIGLAIVKKIVENHNGFITASGELNKGAIFNIYIPR